MQIYTKKSVVVWKQGRNPQGLRLILQYALKNTNVTNSKPKILAQWKIEKKNKQTTKWNIIDKKKKLKTCNVEAQDVIVEGTCNSKMGTGEIDFTYKYWSRQML